LNASDHCIALRPICSPTVRAASFFFGFVCMTSLGIAALMATQGFWPVLPFAGLEMLVLGWALAISLRNRHVVQRLAISDNEVRFVGASVEHLVFPRQWAKVTLRAPHAVCTPAGY